MTEKRLLHTPILKKSEETIFGETIYTWQLCGTRRECGSGDA